MKAMQMAMMENIPSIIYRRFVSDENFIPVESRNEIQIMIAIDMLLATCSGKILIPSNVRVKFSRLILTETLFHREIGFLSRKSIPLALQSEFRIFSLTQFCETWSKCDDLIAFTISYHF